MTRYILLRLAATIPVLLGISLVLFTLLRLIPGDPTHAILLAMVEPGADISQLERDRAVLRHQLGLDEPFPVQYASWLGSILRGNLGTSFRSRAPIAAELALRLPATIQLAAAALLVMVAVAVPTGILGAVYHGRTGDRLARFVSLLGVSLPGFFLALLLMYAFSVRLGWLPTFGLGIRPPTPEWGAMLNEARPFVERAPWVFLAPGAVIFLVVMSANYLGDAVRDAFDPRRPRTLPMPRLRDALRLARGRG